MLRTNLSYCGVNDAAACPVRTRKRRCATIAAHASEGEYDG